MKTQVHTFQLDLDWELVQQISQIDRFDASWSTIEKREGQSLKHLKAIATVRSVGASTRIEGSKMSDEEVQALLHHLDISKLSDRDSQEVVGYFDTLDQISEAYNEIPVTESATKHLHAILMKYSRKDEWHKGDYKQHSNAVEAQFPDGTRQLIFQTTEPGFPTQDAMRAMVDWFHADKETHPLVKAALFTYEFVSIHPFQDGNGRLSRLLSTLLLLKAGYKWIQYVSLEHEIESRKPEYYQVLRNCQVQRPNEDVTEWVRFFFDALKNIQQQLMQKLEREGMESNLSPREKSILTFVEANPGCRSGEISSKLKISSPTVKRILQKLMEQELLQQHGAGAGTNYTVK